MPVEKHVIVVGAGIIGASIAWHLVRAGARVTVVEANRPGGMATPASFAWVNATWGNPERYFRLRQRSMREWTRLAADVPAIPLACTGGLCWDLPAAEFEAFEALHAAWGYDIRRVTHQEAARIEPKLLGLPSEALHVKEEGSVEPVAASLALLSHAGRLGARLISGQVKALRRAGDRIIGINIGSALVEADEIVLAAGIATPALAATAGVDVELDTPPGLIVHSRPHERLLNGIVLAEQLHMRQTAEGRVIAGADFGGGDPGEDAAATAQRLFAKLKGMLKGGERLEFDFHTVGLRPTPKDGFPIVSRADGIEGLYLAVMHSGITLAPAVGLFAAEELMTGERDALIAPYALSRPIALQGA